jgi:hypothetical protein
LLTDQDEMSNLYREPSIDASYKVVVHLAKRFQRRRFLNRGSQESGIAHLVFNLTENGGVTHNFENGPPKDHFNSNF